jgi:hypothetical protein
MRVTATSGVLWITEEGSVDDVVLLEGATHRIANAGLALVLAHRTARGSLEVPAGILLPRGVEIARADGLPGRRVRFAPDWPFSARAVAATIRTAIRKVATMMQEFGARPALPAPVGGRYEHDCVHSSWRTRDIEVWNEPASARSVMSRRYFFPYY